MSLISNLPAAITTANNILPFAIVGSKVADTIAKVPGLTSLRRFINLPSTVTAALFAVAFFGTGTATVAGAATFVAVHTTARLLDVECIRKEQKSILDAQGNRIYQKGRQVRHIPGTDITVGQVIDNVSKACLYAAAIGNAAAAIFMAYTNPASTVNIIGAILLSKPVVDYVMPS